MREKKNMKKKGNALLCEALSVPAASSVSGQCNQALKDSLFTFYQQVLVCIFSIRGKCVTRVCVHTRVPGGSIVHQHSHVLTTSQGNKAKGPVLFWFPLGGGNFPCIAVTLQDASPPLPSLLCSFFLMLSTSVPVLVFVVPAVEVYVERNDASGRHASDQRSEGGEHVCKKHTFIKKILHIYKRFCKNKYKSCSQLLMSRMHSY